MTATRSAAAGMLAVLRLLPWSWTVASFFAATLLFCGLLALEARPTAMSFARMTGATNVTIVLVYAFGAIPIEKPVLCAALGAGLAATIVLAGISLSVFGG